MCASTGCTPKLLQNITGSLQLPLYETKLLPFKIALEQLLKSSARH